MTLSQSNAPRLWKWFQYLVGGTVDKRKLCRLKHTGQKHILEIGCSVGNTAGAFTGLAGVDYTGLDIDRTAIEFARRDYARYPHFRFRCGGIRDLAREGARFDFVLVAGVLHHMPDDQCRHMLEAAAIVATDNGAIVVVDPVLPEADDPWLMRAFLRLERGGYVRSDGALRALVGSVRGLSVVETLACVVGATPFSLPRCARFAVQVLRRSAFSCASNCVETQHDA